MAHGIFSFPPYFVQLSSDMAYVCCGCAVTVDIYIVEERYEPCIWGRGVGSNLRRSRTWSLMRMHTTLLGSGLWKTTGNTIGTHKRSPTYSSHQGKSPSVQSILTCFLFNRYHPKHSNRVVRTIRPSLERPRRIFPQRLPNWPPISPSRGAHWQPQVVSTFPSPLSSARGGVSEPHPPTPSPTRTDPEGG